MNNLKTTLGTMSEMSPSETLAISAKAKALKAQGIDVCIMSAGEPDFQTPQIIKQACIDALQAGKTTYTPSDGIIELRNAIVDKFNKDNGIKTTASQVIVSPGAKFSDFIAVAALCGPGDEVIIPAPYWVSYPQMVKAAGATCVFVNTLPENNYEVMPDELEAVVTDKTKLMILCTPSNPTGSVYRREALEKIAAIAVKHNFMILADEIYEKLVFDADKPHISIGSLNDDIAELTVTVNGFSKAYAMTGWRLGYLTAPKWLAVRISALQSHLTSNPTTFAQYGALKALEEGAAECEKMRQVFASRRDLICDLLAKVPGTKTPRPSGAFYVMIDISSFGIPSIEFCDRLIEEAQVAAVPGTGFGAEGTIRFSYACDENTIKKAVERLASFCAKL
ncbi:MAG: pyridoxal phosphate-dependent aminotransferase [Victivallaceae bacterium]|nr:pyridoxal phosphate-dependent aminotransferase [Victivallaceae bacterium]MDD3703692.1 pyridoxal phosphate-dependent aminotransferase [Victivallaceae bacterium]MDD4318349.1 pyridoxal phosphate-dependent aminotransferase [Victivallaceae bacterium]MDD5663928.1 pyridoxal phosphate-dependent aminotransferase [Victivallaceae bacterium]NLK82494.1 pyridoxal phosphate-dependent aminotransferase [Lentisphaerota bacterium]